MSTRGLGRARRPVRYPALRVAVETEMDRRDWEVTDLARSTAAYAAQLVSFLLRAVTPA